MTGRPRVFLLLLAFLAAFAAPPLVEAGHKPVCSYGATGPPTAVAYMFLHVIEADVYSVLISWHQSETQNGANYGYVVQITSLDGSLTTVETTPPTLLPSRPGWFYSILSVYVDSGGNNARLVVQAEDLACGPHAVASCALIIDVSGGTTGRAQCGARVPEPLAGASAIVTQARTETEPGVVELRYTRSPTDPGDGGYTFFWRRAFQGEPLRAFTQGEQIVTDEPNNLALMTFPAAQTAANSTVRFAVILDDFEGGSPHKGTTQISNLSCEVAVDIERHGHAAACGDAPLPTLAPAAPCRGDGPCFPLVDIEATAAAFDISATALGYLLASIFFLAAVAGGFFYAGPVGAGSAGAIAFGAMAAMRLIPLWFLVVVFGLMAVYVVYGFRRGS